MGLDLAEGTYRIWSNVMTRLNPSSHPCDPNLGVLGTKQMGWRWSRDLGFVMPNTIRDIHVQVPGLSPV